VATPGAWVRRHRVLAAFAAGALLALAAVALVGYLVLADQRRSARVLAAALTRALEREVRIDRVTELGPSRVVMQGVRLPADRGWPAEVAVESVEASGPLLAAARGEPAPVRIVVTGPTVTAGGGGGAGLAAVEGLRRPLQTLLRSPGLIDLSLTSGAIEVPGAGGDAVTFDLTLRKGAGDARAEVLVRGRQGPAFTIGLDARADGELVRVSVTGAGPLAPLGAWLPAALAGAAGPTPAELRLALALEPDERARGSVALRLGARAALDGRLALEPGVVRLAEGAGGLDLPFAFAAAGIPGTPEGRLELAGAEVTWRPGTPGLPEARGTLRLADGLVPAAAVGTDVRVRGLEVPLVAERLEDGVLVRGELRAAHLAAVGLELAPVRTEVRVGLDARAAVRRAEVSGLTARLLGAPVRGAVTYDGSSGRADGRLEADAVPLEGLARRVAPGWLGPTDRLRAGSLRVTVAGLDARTLGQGRADAELRALALRRPDGEALVDRARLDATLRPGAAALGLDARQVRGSLPILQGTLPRLEATAELARAGAAVALRRAALQARDAEGRDMLRVEAGPVAGGGGPGPVRLTARAPALERLAPLWPGVARRITGTASLQLEAPDVRFASYAGRLALEVPEAEFLDGRLGIRQLSAEMPVAQGRPAGRAAAGPLRMGEVIGYGMVAYDVAGRAAVVDQRLHVDDLRYLLYSGEGGGSIEAGYTPDGLSARARLTGERVRIEEFMSAYGIRGGTMTGLLRYDLGMRYEGGRPRADGRLAVPDGGTVTIELLERLFQYTAADPTGVVRRALENLRAFDYKSADMTVRTASDDIRVSLSLRGRERFGIFPPRVKEINVRDMPLGFLGRQFPGQ
jgi:hypothetical protein